MRLSSNWLSACFSALAYIIALCSAQCKIGQNDNKDWIIMYKPSDIREGLLLIPAAAGWAKSDLSATSDQNPLHNIAGELNKKPAAAAGQQPVILTFNALPPRSSSPPATQSKSTGVFFYEPSAAFATYLIHSVPQWPDMYDTATVLAELGKKTMPAMLLCLMLPSGEISNWAKGMAYESPLIYFYQNNIENADITNEDVRKLVEAEAKIFSVKPSTLDLYSSVINLGLGTTMTIWNIAGKGADIVPKACRKFYKVQYVNASEVQILTQTIKRDDDKTIWAYSENGTWLCVSNSPRQASQLKVSKGAVCINDAAAHAAFKALAKTVDGCP
uniref:Plancitoxin-1 n=1 Tax=Trichuris muris TaxID=70415 RepID=A0A5S6QK94_TRIMR